MSNYTPPMPARIKMPPVPTQYMWADTQFTIIKKYIQDFEASLDEEHEVGILLTNFGQSVLMEVHTITYEESVLLVFSGLVDGHKATLIQHINQLNFLLKTIEKNPESTKKKIGFEVSKNKQ